METLLLSLLLMSGSSAGDSQSASSGIRVQAKARARIINGEVIRFGEETSDRLSASRINDAQTILLPVAHSKGRSDSIPQSELVEFY